MAILFGGGGLLALLKPRGQCALLQVAAILAVLSGLGWLALTFAGLTGDPDDLLRLDAWHSFFASPFGLPWGLRLAILAACGIAAMQRRIAPFVVLGLMAILDQAWLGHAAAETGASAVPMILAYWIHVLAGFAWIGGLTLLCTLIARRERDLAGAGLALVSTFGIAIVAAILASGVVNASVHLARTADLATTGYGRLLVAKAVLVLAMIGLAVFNRRRTRGWSRGLVASVAIETCLGLGVLLAAAMLGISEPPG